MIWADDDNLLGGGEPQPLHTGASEPDHSDKSDIIRPEGVRGFLHLGALLFGGFEQLNYQRLVTVA